MNHPPIPRVLVIDDTQLIRTLIARKLQGEGFRQVALAKDADDALAQIETSPPDLILLDIIMPGAHGTEILTTLRQRLPEVLIVMMTSLCEAEVVRQCKERGADGFIIKTSDGLAGMVYEKIVALWERRTGHRIQSVRRSDAVVRPFSAPGSIPTPPRASSDG